MTLITRSAADLLRDLESRKLSSVELTRAYLDQIQKHDSKIKAFLLVDPDAALARAKEIDERRSAGKPGGKLGGLPVAIKDVMCTQGVKTTCASKILQDFVPPYDATVIAKLKAADAVLIGKTNMDEFAMGGSTENSAFQKTANPWDLERTPGGSSGGAAACVAAGMAPLSVGTDTGGSIRQPAGLCGVTGLKPTYGRVSRYGLVAFASSLDQIGPLARSVEDAARLYKVVAGKDPLDSTTSAESVGSPEAALRTDAPVRVGIPRAFVESGLDAGVRDAFRAALDELRATG